MTAAPVAEKATEETGEAPEYVQPADVVDEETIEAEAGTIETFGGFGALALDPRQKHLTDEQKLALVAIGIDTVNDPQIVPHVRPFIHMCQTRGLDPWRREAYLIGRGQIGGNDRKFTMQVAIDGYRNMAQGTGRFSRVSERLWTGPGDDTGDWYRDDRGIMRRVWWDSWPDAKGQPGIAKVIVEHYDVEGRLTETEGEANWGMYAPYYKDKRTGLPTLGDFWTKGGGHMLSKCAEALGYRTAFPGAMAGMYLHEEMHQADAAEATRIAALKADQRRAKVIDLRPAPAVGSKDGTSMPMDLGSILTEAMAKAKPAAKPAPAAPAAGEVVDAELVEADDATPPGPVQAVDRRELLLAELAEQARIVGSTVPALTRMWVATHKRNVDDERTTADELAALVASFRPMVVGALRAAGQARAAEAYSQVRPEDTGTIDYLFGGERAATP